MKLNIMKNLRQKYTVDCFRPLRHARLLEHVDVAQDDLLRLHPLVAFLDVLDFIAVQSQLHIVSVDQRALSSEDR